MPLEQIHVHIAEGRASADVTKLWITSTGKAILCNNNSQIPERILRKIIRILKETLSLLRTIGLNISVK